MFQTKTPGGPQDSSGWPQHAPVMILSFPPCPPRDIALLLPASLPALKEESSSEIRGEVLPNLRMIAHFLSAPFSLLYMERVFLLRCAEKVSGITSVYMAEETSVIKMTQTPRCGLGLQGSRPAPPPMARALPRIT